MKNGQGIVNWNQLALNAGVLPLAGFLARKLGVRSFVVRSGVGAIDLNPEVKGGATIFDEFWETGAQWVGGSSTASRVEVESNWQDVVQRLEGSTGRGKEVVETGPGFAAHFYALGMPEVDVQAAVVITGFMSTEDAAAKVEGLRKAMPEYLEEQIDKGEGPAIPQLDRSERRWVDHFGNEMARRFREGLEGDEAHYDADGSRFMGMIGASDAMTRVFKDITKVAGSEASVLVTGENGTGKELVARAIHRRSRRREAPFLAINCAAIPGDLITSELFGHVKGAFSGAHRDRQGLFEAADGGTLLLDEIGDMEPMLQSKLLRVLQEGTLVRVGDNQVRRVNVRVLCATNCDLEKEVRAGRFRRDLYFRIRVVELALPPLRERRSDIARLARYFLGRAVRRHERSPKRLGKECMEALQRYDWPGNVRELENEIERLVILAGDSEVIERQWLSARIAESEEPKPSLDFEGYELPEAIEWVERKMILDGLRETGWNKTQTAKNLGVSRRNLIRKVSKYELEQYRDN